ncbi:MAG: NAD-dependent epimerase/dehydratase family protein [Thermoleophilia bacterium]|nr:NAD-dependent epimerase/dehydratase family protein [Thermoleophilia bacterium]
MSRVLVTGGQGFIGGHLVKALLDRGDEVVVLDLPSAPGGALALHGILAEVELIEGDVADREAVGRAVAGADSLFHLAAQTLVGPAAADPLGTFRTNVEGTWTVLEAARGAGPAAVVVASSDKAYGPSDSLPYREDDELRPAATYEGSKAAADVIARSYRDSWEMPVAVTRLANVYGGGDLNRSRLVPEVVRAFLDGRAPKIRSDGSPRRDFLHVSDAVAAYLAIEAAVIAGPGRGEALNAGTGEAHSVRELIGLIREKAGSAQEPDFEGEGSPPGEIDEQYVDPSKLADLTGWTAALSLDEGIGEAVEWYRQYR